MKQQQQITFIKPFMAVHSFFNTTFSKQLLPSFTPIPPLFILTNLPVTKIGIVFEPPKMYIEFFLNHSLTKYWTHDKYAYAKYFVFD